MIVMLERFIKSLAISSILVPLFSCFDSSSSGPVIVVETCFDLAITAGATTGNHSLCTTNENGQYNGLGVRRFARFSITADQSVTITANRISGNSPADPDLLLYRNGQMIRSSLSVTNNREAMTVLLTAGDYVVELFEYNYVIPDFKMTSSINKFLSLLQTKTGETDLLTSTTKILPAAVLQAPSNCSNTFNITVSGNASYERVPNVSGALDYSSIVAMPIRGAEVEVICDGGTYATTTTDVNGDYSINAPVSQESFIRVKAQMKQTGTPSWDFSVVDNTRSQYLYVMDSGLFNEANNITRDLLAESGWDTTNNTGYISERVAAPFAILDSVYVAFNKIRNVAPATAFPQLKLNWSINNVPVIGDISIGQITITHFDGTDIYILGAEDVDTDEYDEDVIIHEWGHYFQEAFSRDDSIGGEHMLGDRLDIRVAFSEGFGNAFSAIATDDPVYVDTNGVQQSAGFRMNINNNNCFNPGWYSECSIQSVIYDLYDDDVAEGIDHLSLGLQPIYDVLVGDALRNSPAFTSIFSFITYLKNNNLAAANNIDTLVSAQNIDPVTDIYGDSELNNNPGVTDQLPVYTAY